jgi:hypothetical protein
MPNGTVVLSPIYETAASVHFAYEFAKSSPRIDYVGAIATNGGDIQREIGAQVREQCSMTGKSAPLAHSASKVA